MEFYLGKMILSLNLQDYFTFVVLYTAEFLIILFFLLISAFSADYAEKYIFSLLKKKNLSARLNVCNSLKILANSFKLFFKEIIVPDKSEKIAFFLAPAILLISVLFIYSLIPYNTDFCVNKADSGLVSLISLILLFSFGITLGGISSNSNFSILGAMRHCVQLISFSVPMILTFMGVAVLSSSLSFPQIVISQAKYDILSWYIFPSFLGFVVFFIISSAIVNRSPYNFSNAKSELADGYKTEYSGVNLAIINLSEFSLFFIINMISVILFFGGFLSPFGVYVADWFSAGSFYYIILTVEQMFWLFAKTIFLIFFTLLIQTAFPRLKPVNLASFSWKYLIPVSIINILIVCVIKIVFGGFYV